MLSVSTLHKTYYRIYIVLNILFTCKSKQKTVFILKLVTWIHIIDITLTLSLGNAALWEPSKGLMSDLEPLANKSDSRVQHKNMDVAR